MSEIQVDQFRTLNDEVGFKELILKIIDWITYLKTKWVVIFLCVIIGSGFGFVYAYFQKTIYTATLTFALEDEKSGVGGSLTGAMGLASSLGIDLGTSAGGAFSGANLSELMKSRTLVEKALLSPITVKNKRQSLATYFIEFNHMNNDWDLKPMLKNIQFEPLSERRHFTFQQDSILGILYDAIGGVNGLLSVVQKDKKISIIGIEVKSVDEFFSKYFAESIAKEVSEFYVETKSKKAKINVAILQKQTDSIRNELNAAITGVASSADNTFNLNPALNIKRTPSTKRQIDVQANTAILTQLVTNLEMAKVTLLKETPLIQVIDKPILPLKKQKISKLKSIVVFGFLAGSLSLVVIIIRRLWNNLMNERT